MSEKAWQCRRIKIGADRCKMVAKRERRVADKDKSHTKVLIINHRQQCLCRSHYLSIESVAATRPKRVRRLSQIGKAGEAWDGIGLEGERASLLRGGDLKYRRSSKDTQLKPIPVWRNSLRGRFGWVTSYFLIPRLSTLRLYSVGDDGLDSLVNAVVFMCESHQNNSAHHDFSTADFSGYLSVALQHCPIL